MRLLRTGLRGVYGAEGIPKCSACIRQGTHIKSGLLVIALFAVRSQ
jgi:hypothetical protein